MTGTTLLDGALLRATVRLEEEVAALRRTLETLVEEVAAVRVALQESPVDAQRRLDSPGAEDSPHSAPPPAAPVPLATGGGAVPADFPTTFARRRGGGN